MEEFVFKNNHTQTGAKIVSVSINNPIVTERVVLEPIVIQIKPNRAGELLIKIP